MSIYRTIQDPDEEDKTYMSDTRKSTESLARTGESVYIEYIKFHDYDRAESEDDFWDYRTGRLDDDENYFIVSRKEHQELENGDKTYTFLLTDTGSTRGIMTKFYLRQGVLYTLQSLIDTIDGPSEYVGTFFNTFKPLDTLIGRPILEDKAALFFKNANGEDSLQRVNAIKSIQQIDFEAKDVPNIISTYENFQYSKDGETDERKDLIMALGNIKSDTAYQFLYKTFEENSFDSDIQFIVLKSFSYTESQEAYDAIKKLLLENTPVTDDKHKLSFFDNLYDSLELSKNYFPELLDLATSYPEYKPYLTEMLAWGYANDIYTPANFKSKAEMLKRNAMIELKKVVADQEKDEKASNENYHYRSLYETYHTALLDYYAIMCGLKAAGVPKTESFFEGLERINDKRFFVECQVINHKLKLAVDTARINQAMADYTHSVWTYNRLKENEMLNYVQNFSQEKMAKGLLYYTDYDKEKDSVLFIEKRLIDNGVDKGYVYFFRRKQEDDLNWMVDYVGLQPYDEKKVESDDQMSKTGLAYRNEIEMHKTIDKTLDIFEYANRKRVVVTTGYDWDWGSMFGY